jgi:1-acyl-sn-glycerol-3-phosphate acyltransferase
MIPRLSRWILALSGWQMTHPAPEGVDRFVLVIAPHTSMWDFVWGKLILTGMKLRVKFMIKKEIFWFPLGPLLKWLGGIPVDRGRGNMMIHQVVDAFEHYRGRGLTVVITPEGTRSPTRYWKKGFYRIAMSAKVPVAVGYLDYATRTYGIVFTFEPTGDFDKDCAAIPDFYSNKVGKHPERFLLPEWKNN